MSTFEGSWKTDIHGLAWLCPRRPAPHLQGLPTDDVEALELRCLVCVNEGAHDEAFPLQLEKLERLVADASALADHCQCHVVEAVQNAAKPLPQEGDLRRAALGLAFGGVCCLRKNEMRMSRWLARMILGWGRVAAGRARMHIPDLLTDGSVSAACPAHRPQGQQLLDAINSGPVSGVVADRTLIGTIEGPVGHPTTGSSVGPPLVNPTSVDESVLSHKPFHVMGRR